MSDVKPPNIQPGKLGDRPDSVTSRPRGSIREIADRAYLYCQTLARTDASDLVAHVMNLDASLHDLQLACGFDPCEPGTCGGFIGG